MSQVRCIVAGPRTFTDRGAVRGSLDRFLMIHPEAFLMMGGAPGVDEIARLYTVEIGQAHTVYPADWKSNGRRAGPLRNQQMIDEGKATHLLAVKKRGEDTPGTSDMIRRATAANLIVKIEEF